ncbi:unannotated protein [freshwater metagenome]|uniref:Unannotated protein n=1 Tax=freshwater metagenome TaxID=449393 RepID=A0A6J6NX61_9ZZZZ
MRRTRPASSCNGLSTGIAAIVVQLGLAMMRLWAFAISLGLTSLTMSGTSGSMRHADELSMTITPAAEKRGASTRDDEAPLENRAMSRPEGSAVSASSTVIWRSPHGNVVPAERDDAKKRMSLTGKFRSARMARMTLPT